jgi:hypothetical protein
MKITQQEEIVTLSNDDGHSMTATPFFAGRQLTSGVAVFSSTRRALYVDEAAQELLMRLNRKENEHSTHGAIPSSINNLLDEMLRLLRKAGMHHGWKQLEARWLVAAPNQGVRHS